MEMGHYSYSAERLDETLDGSEGSQETHQDSVVKEATLHLYRRNHGSASAVKDVTPSLSAITASFKITAKRVATAYIRRTAIAS